MRILVIIQARTGSKRLHNKVLMKIQGKPILEHIVNFLKFSKKIDQIIVATSNLKPDDEIEKLCDKIGVSYFRGNSLNVLKRYFDCAVHSSRHVLTGLPPRCLQKYSISLIK